jgi:hypothetical protein
VSVNVICDWLESPRLEVILDGQNQLKVRADLRLSELQIERACQELGDDGPVVLSAWRTAVGIYRAGELPGPVGHSN